MGTDWTRIAVIDLGSNTARVVILQSIPGYAYRLEDQIREVVRLREGMTARGLSDPAVERAIFTLKLFKHFCKAVGAATIIPVATSAVRDAANGPQFVARVEREVGLKLTVLSGEREAYYGAIGALNEVPITNGFVVDVGGGSAQVSEVRDGTYRRGESLGLGALALTERFVDSDPISAGDYYAVENEICQQLDRLSWVQPYQGWRVVGLGGTMRNIAKIESKRQGYPLATLHGFTLTRDALAETIRQLRDLPLAKRSDIPGLNADRADIILPGAMTILGVMDHVKAEAITISENGLREGLFFEQFWTAQSPPIVANVRHFGVLNMARIYRYQKEHAHHVRFLVQRLFAQLAPLHGYDSADLEILEAAALLHDLGILINYDAHHKHSQMLIDNAGLPGYTPREIALIALLTRYHRKGTPGVNDYASLLHEGDDVLLTRLSAILRMAEYLERGRSGAVDDVIVSWTGSTLVLSLVADSYPAIEMWDAERNAVPLMAAAYGREVRLETISPPGQ